jgi:TadE-like protein
VRSVLAGDADRHGADRHGAAGSVTAEFVVVIPAVVFLLISCMTGIQLASEQLRLQDAASIAARSSAAGESEAVVLSRVANLVPGSGLSFTKREGLVCARVSLAPEGPLPSLFGMALVASSCSLAGDK